MRAPLLVFGLSMLLLDPTIAQTALSQETPTATDTAEKNVDLAEQASQTLESAKKTAEALSDAVDQNEQAREITAGILEPIYALAEAFAFPTFHWLAFSLMTLGVVSFALQLTLGKLVVLGHGGFSGKEILSDLVALGVSVVGLVLTTQAAAENSNFTESSVAVLSSAAVGLAMGFIFYLWGQSQEVQATRGRSKQEATKEEPERE